MITIPTTFTTINPTVAKYTYTITLFLQNSSFTTFKVSDYITDTQRAYYGYNSSTSKVVGLGFAVKSWTTEYATSSTMDVPSHLRLRYDYANLNLLGATNAVPSGSNNWIILGGFVRASTTSTNVRSTINPNNEVYLVTNSSSLAVTSALDFALRPYNNSATALSSSDYVQIVLEYSEYLSRY